LFKSILIKTLVCSLMALILAACGGTPSAQELQTAVAETLAAMPPSPAEQIQVVEITELVRVTQLTVIDVTATPRPTEAATATLTPTETPEFTPTPGALLVESTATPTPVTESGALGLTLNQLIRRYGDMTDLQKQEYAKTLPGKTVFWIAEVYNVTTDGTMILDNPYGGGRVTLKGVPIETALAIDKGMLIEFRGMIESFGGSFGRDIVVVNPVVVRYYFEPTATPTERR
jgi:hypothetical protein